MKIIVRNVISERARRTENAKCPCENGLQFFRFPSEKGAEKFQTTEQMKDDGIHKWNFHFILTEW